MVATILAGGENKRFPFNKCLLEIDNKKLIERNKEILKKYFKRVILSTNNPEIYFCYELELVGDILKERGPMTGILSVLNLPDVLSTFVIACDMPFIKEELIKYILDKWTEEYDIVVPIFNNKPQPLFGIYSKRIIKSIEENIKKGEKSLCKLIRNKNVYFISEEVVKRIDSEGKTFININTLEDYKKGIGGEICLV